MAINPYVPTIAVGNGTQVDFLFTFPYLNQLHVKASINDTLTTAFTFFSTNVLRFSVAPAAGATVLIFRETPADALAAVIQPGGPIPVVGLNQNFLQSLYYTQEAPTQAYIDAADALKVSKSGDTMSGQLDMGGNRITNLGAPTVDADGVTKLYVDQRYGQLGVPGLTRWRKIATAGQTVFSGAGEDSNTLAYSASRESVFINGAYQQRGVDYTANNGTSITITPALLAGDVIEVHCVNNVAGAVTDQSSGIYFTQSGTGATVRTVDSKLKELVSVRDFGAVGDGIVDDTAAIQAAIDSMIPRGRGTVFLPPGTYRTTSTFTVYGLSVNFEGDGGEFSTTLLGDFIGGPVLTIGSSRRTRIRNLHIKSSTTRSTTGGTADIGILVTPGDTGTNRVTHSVFENLYIIDQPSHGFASIGATWDNLYSRIIVQQCKGHGFIFDDGSSFGYATNLQLPGICQLEFCESADNTGHGLLIGNDTGGTSNRGLRFVIESCDFYRNAQAAGIRKAATNLWIFGELCQIRSSAINGSNQAQTAAVNSLIYIYGRSNVIRDCRLLGSANPSAIYVGGTISGYDTNGLTVENCQLIDEYGGMALDPVVNIDAAARNVRVLLLNPNNVISAKTLSANNSQFARVETVYQLADQIVNNTTTVVNSSDLKLTLYPKQKASFKFQLFFTGDVNADIRFALIYPSGSTCYYSTTGNVRLNSADVVSSNDVETGGGIFIVGTGGSILRGCEISGYIETTGTAGDLVVRFAQGTAVAADTTLKANSSLTLIS
jgi:hypothetical protein